MWHLTSVNASYGVEHDHVLGTDFSCRIKVMDDDAFQKDRLIGWSCFRLDRFPQGLRLLQLKGPDAKISGGALLVDSHITLK